MKRASVNFKTTNIKGKQYVEVKERLKYLADNFDYSINTDYQYFEARKMWVVKATLTITAGNGDKFTFTGLAQELESDSYKDVNHTSALENAETSAVGRACAMAGIGIDISVASADEMNKAFNRVAQTNPGSGGGSLAQEPEFQGATAKQVEEITALIKHAKDSELMTDDELKAYWKGFKGLSFAEAAERIKSISTSIKMRENQVLAEAKLRKEGVA